MTNAGDSATRSVVLVVDDTPDTLGFLTEALERHGYMALVATGGLQAIALVGRITPDLILLDAMMPGMDGFETCRTLKLGPAGHVPIIFMTALSETEHVVAGLSAGGVDYVTKPIVLDELFARIHVHLRNAKAAESTRLALDRAGSSLLSLRADGTIHWSTPQATQLLEGLITAEPERLRIVDPIAGRLRHIAQQAGAEIVVTASAGPVAVAFVGTVGADERLYRISPHDPRSDEDILASRLSLTAREAEVLLWVARGKSNRDVADILALSPRTVNKHLETIFAKIGVENRASAAVLVMRTLDER